MYIGIDLGTSGVRACAIDAQETLVAQCTRNLPSPVIEGDAVYQDASLWWQTVEAVLSELCGQLDCDMVKSIAIDGTSGTLLLTDVQGNPLTPALMYNDNQCQQEAERIKNVAPAQSAAHGSSSGLAKLLRLQMQHPEAKHALHQADWVAAKLCGNFSISDENNALKTGYDPLSKQWPEWLDQLGINRALLPEVVTPGTVIGTITQQLAEQFGLNTDVKIVAGTTDSIAAFIATGARQPGEAVTSLGSTLVLKIISEQPIYAAEYGIYSHRLGDHWLAGGASNCGGAVLRKFFSDEQLDEMTPQLQPDQSTGCDFYPLVKTGERFPVNDAAMQPRLDPRPANDVVFFQGLLESLARIEQDGYRKLHELGAPWPVSVKTAGGGSKNSAWTSIRQHMLGVNVETAEQTEACYGTALLAKRALTKG